jgi:hypothetical protein
VGFEPSCLFRDFVIPLLHNVAPPFSPQETKKADVAEHPEVFDHAGLLGDEPSSYAGMLLV